MNGQVSFVQLLGLDSNIVTFSSQDTILLSVATTLSISSSISLILDTHSLYSLSAFGDKVLTDPATSIISCMILYIEANSSEVIVFRSMTLSHLSSMKRFFSVSSFLSFLVSDNEPDELID